MAMHVHGAAVDQAKKLIREGKVVMESDWSKVQPSASDENKYLDSNDFDAYAKWYLARDTDNPKDTKGGHNFPYGDFKNVHRQALIAAKQRAAQNDYNTIEKAADELLQMIDEADS